MRKLAMILTALLFAATFGMGAAATASTPYTPTLVKLFNADSDTDFAVESIVPLNESLAVVQLDNDDIWLTDGTAEGTTELNTLATESGLNNWNFWSSSEDNRVVSDGNGKLYFWGHGSGAEGDNNNVWSFDGETFDKVTNIDFGGYRSTMYFLDGELYVWAGNRASNTWLSLHHVDTSTGDVIELAGGNDCEWARDSLSQVVSLGGKIIFSNDAQNNCDFRLHAWDPSNPETEPIDLNGATDAHPDNFPSWESWGVFEGELYFGADNVEGDEELWATDGTVAGTRLVKDISEGEDSFPGKENRMWFTEFRGELYFNAFDWDADEYFLYKTDGTAEGTVLAVDQLNDPGDCIESIGLVVGNSMFTDFECELYVTDGSTATLLTPNLGNGGGMSDDCWDYCTVPVSFDNQVFFTYKTQDIEGESNSVWVTDGTVAGTHSVTDFSANAIGTENSFNLVQLGSRLLFGVSDYQDQGGTGEMALYAIDAQSQTSASGGSPNLAKTGFSNELFIVAGSMAIIAGAAFLAISRRKRTA